jgi:hypothetical protein
MAALMRDMKGLCLSEFCLALRPSLSLADKTHRLNNATQIPPAAAKYKDKAAANSSTANAESQDGKPP